MVQAFSCDEVLEIAQQIERNGAAFYLRAAETADDVYVRQTLRDLSAMETNHERVFAEMAGGRPDGESQPPSYDPRGEAVQYLRALAGGYIFDLRANPAEWLDDGKSMAEILRTAIDLEKDSIVFYVGAREAVTGDASKQRIEGVVREELAHLSLLSDRLALLNGQP